MIRPVTMTIVPQLSFIDYPTADKGALVYYMYGCDFRCKGCQNPTLQSSNPEYVSKDMAREFTVPDDMIDFMLKMDDLENRGDRLAVLQGGDPLAIWNCQFLAELIFRLYKRKTGLKVCIYTGNCFNAAMDLIHANLEPLLKDEGLDIIQVLGEVVPFIKTGLFDERKYQNSGKYAGIMYLGSTNQHMYVYNARTNEYENVAVDGKFALSTISTILKENTKNGI